MASRNLTQRLEVALGSKALAANFLSAISSRSELPQSIKDSVTIAMADKKIGREVCNSVDTGASLSQKTIKQLSIVLASNEAAKELQDLLENTAADAEAGIGAAAPVEPPALEEDEEYPKVEATPDPEP